MMDDTDELNQELKDVFNLVTQQANHERALEICTRLIEKYPSRSEGFRKRAWVHADRGDFGRAITDLSAAIELSSKQPEYFALRGRWNLIQGYFDAAVEDESKAIELGDELDLHYYDESAYFFRAVAYFYKDDLDRMMFDLKYVRNDFLVYLARIGKLSKVDLINRAESKLSS